MNKVNESIRQIRKLKGFSQSDIAHKLAMQQPNYQRIEKGLTSLDHERLRLIASALDCSLEFIENFDIENLDTKPVQKTNEIVLHISPELKAIYEGRIEVLEACVARLRHKIYLKNAKSG